MRKQSGLMLGVMLVFAVCLLTVVSVAHADITIQYLYGTQYDGGNGLFAAILGIQTDEHVVDATLTLPDGQILHPRQTWVYRNQVFFKFAVKGTPLDAAGDEIEAFVSGDAGGSAHATVSCAPYRKILICR